MSHGTSLRSELRKFLISSVAKATGLPIDEIDTSEPVTALGVDSMHAMEIVNQIEQQFDLTVADTLIWDNPTIELIIDSVIGEIAPEAAPAALDLSTPSTRSAEPIAIIGLACRYPGAADASELWTLLQAAGTTAREVPADRWDVDALYDAVPETMGRMVSRSGGFLDDVDKFDSLHFGVTAAEADAMDPQQRILLETAWTALEDASVSFDDLPGSATGVFTGVFGTDYNIRFNNDSLLINSHVGLGNSLASLSNRVSYVFGLHGPSLTVGAVCASSLVTIQMACESLRSGESDLALAGGVNLMLEPHTSIWYSQMGMLSPDGRCKSFSLSADGLARAEGVGIVVLKRLSDAVRDGDDLYAVVRGGAIGHNGQSNGPAAPSGRAQIRVMSEALRRSGVTPADVDYVEAHGTGTLIGDRVELGALREVLRRSQGSADRCRIGTIKSIIGHAESAGGVAGVIKTALALHHQRIPPSRIEGELDPTVADSGLTLVTQSLPWPPRPGRRRTALVNAFGMGGTNACLVLQEPANARTVDTYTSDGGGTYAFPVSASTPVALRASAAQHHKFLTDTAAPMADCCSVVSRRAALAHRAVVIGRTSSEIHAGLAALAHGQSAANVIAGERVKGLLQVAYYFGDRLPVGSDDDPAFQHYADRCYEGLSTHGLADRADDPAVSRYVRQVAVFEQWRALGIEPALVAASGSGRYAAEYACGQTDFFGGVQRLINSVTTELSATGCVELLHIPATTNEHVGQSVLCEYGCAFALGIGASAESLEGFADIAEADTMTTLAQLYVHGASVQWHLVNPAPSGLVRMPTYPFERHRHWTDRPDLATPAGLS